MKKEELALKRERNIKLNTVRVHSCFLCGANGVTLRRRGKGYICIDCYNRGA